MNTISTKLLRSVAVRTEVTLDDAIRFGSTKSGDHTDQFPLALLIEDGYLGCTLNAPLPPGGENMREHFRALSLHMFTLPKGPDGTVTYLQIRSSGNADPKGESVFLKAKGALYLEEIDAKRRERLFTIIVAILSAYLAAWFTVRVK